MKIDGWEPIRTFNSFHYSGEDKLVFNKLKILTNDLKEQKWTVTMFIISSESFMTSVSFLCFSSFWIRTTGFLWTAEQNKIFEVTTAAADKRRVEFLC